MKKFVAFLLLFVGCCLAALTVVLLWPDVDVALDEAEAHIEKSHASLQAAEVPGDARRRGLYGRGLPGVTGYS